MADSDGAAAEQSPEFDSEALREKYRLESDKRMRADGNSQYVWIEGVQWHFTADPNADRISRIDYPKYGCNGIELPAKWASGAAAFHGIFRHGFPNIFIMTLTQSGRTFINVHLLDENAGVSAMSLG